MQEQTRWKAGYFLPSFLCAAAFFLGAGNAHAQNPGWQYSSASGFACTGTTWASSAGPWERLTSAASDLAARATSARAGTGCSPGSYSVTATSSPTYSSNSGGYYQSTIQLAFNGDQGTSASGTVTVRWFRLQNECEWDAAYQGCPRDDTAACAAASGTNERVTYTVAEGLPANGYCSSPEGSGGASCALSISAVRVCLGGVCGAGATYTGEVCIVGPSTPEPDSKRPGDGETCIASGGLTVCGSTSSEQCGTVNGGRWCIDRVAREGCVFVGGGNMICEDGVGTPPGPTNATGDAPATPDGSFQAGAAGGTQNTYNYYSSSTVMASGTAVQAGGEETAGGGGGHGDGEGAPGECELFAETLCEIRDWLTGGDADELPEHPAMPLEDLGEVGVTWTADLGAGACPPPLQISLAGQSISISYQPLCDYAWLFRGLILFGASLSAAGILLGLRL